jgi:hypothetical protein
MTILMAFCLREKRKRIIFAGEGALGLLVGCVVTLLKINLVSKFLMLKRN